MTILNHWYMKLQVSSNEELVRNTKLHLCYIDARQSWHDYMYTSQISCWRRAYSYKYLLSYETQKLQWSKSSCQECPTRGQVRERVVCWKGNEGWCDEIDKEAPKTQRQWNGERSQLHHIMQWHLTNVYWEIPLSTLSLTKSPASDFYTDIPNISISCGHFYIVGYWILLIFLLKTWKFFFLGPGS